MKKTIIAALIAAGIFTSIGGVAYAIANDTPEITGTRTYTVKSGDTLWGIAERYGSNEVDIRETIYDIKELSNCSSNIQAGQKLTLPVYEEE